MPEWKDTPGTGSDANFDAKVRAMEDLLARATMVEESLLSTMKKLDEKIEIASQAKLDVTGLQQEIGVVSDKAKSTDRDVIGIRERCEKEIQSLGDEIRKLTDSVRSMQTRIEQSQSTLARADKAEMQILEIEKSLRETEKIRQDLKEAAATVQDYTRRKSEVEKLLQSMESSSSGATRNLDQLVKKHDQLLLKLARRKRPSLAVTPICTPNWKTWRSALH